MVQVPCAEPRHHLVAHVLFLRRRGTYTVPQYIHAGGNRQRTVCAWLCSCVSFLWLTGAAHPWSAEERPLQQADKLPIREPSCANPLGVMSGFLLFVMSPTSGLRCRCYPFTEPPVERNALSPGTGRVRS